MLKTDPPTAVFGRMVEPVVEDLKELPDEETSLVLGRSMSSKDRDGDDMPKLGDSNGSRAANC
jgi:hypothetical protein